MRIVLVTGRKAYNFVKKIVEENPFQGVEIHVIELPVDIAAFITIEDLLKELPKHRELVEKSDLIVVPGYVQGDLSKVSETIGVKVVKGVKNARDIPLMIKTIKNGVLGSEKEAYDEFLQVLKIQRDREVLHSVRNRALRNKYFNIGNVPVARDYPVVFAEIVLSKGDKVDEVLSKASKLISNGADAIVYGVSDNVDIAIIHNLIKRSKEIFEKPIGIDSSDREILRSLGKHLDVYLSVYPNEIDSLATLREVAITVVPRELDSYAELIDASNKASSLGLNKVIIDPVLQPPMLGLTKSFQRYLEVRERVRSHPLLMGVSNAVELVDADSIGIVALLASIGVEIGVEIYLATEASVKTRRVIYELRKALDMAVIAKETGGPPKDLSFDLLVAKSKKESLYKPFLALNRVVTAKDKLEFAQDPRGFIRISLDYSNEEIVLEHYEHGRNEPDVIIKGSDPLALVKEALDRGLVSRIEHAFYIGVELGKAFKALRSGAEYEQE